MPFPAVDTFCCARKRKRAAFRFELLPARAIRSAVPNQFETVFPVLQSDKCKSERGNGSVRERCSLRQPGIQLLCLAPHNEIRIPVVRRRTDCVRGNQKQNGNGNKQFNQSISPIPWIETSFPHQASSGRKRCPCGQAFPARL